MITPDKERKKLTLVLLCIIIIEGWIFNEMESQVLDLVTEAVKKAEPAEEKLSTFTSTKIKWLNQKRALYNIVISEMSENPQLIRSLKKCYESKAHALLKEILAYRIKNKEFKKSQHRGP